LGRNYGAGGSFTREAAEDITRAAARMGQDRRPEVRLLAVEDVHLRDLRREGPLRGGRAAPEHHARNQLAYLTAHPYGRVTVTLTGCPAASSASACGTYWVALAISVGLGLGMLSIAPA
jgi:hypothetical protein